jgi:dTDP-4-dehydrorhamnose reductase
MKRVLLLGATGMLGSSIYSVLKNKYNLVLAVRNPEKVNLLDQMYGGTKRHQIVTLDVGGLYRDYVAKNGDRGESLSAFLRSTGEVDFVINAIGVTIPFTLSDPPMTFFTNGAFPHILARTFGDRLIHITTDCVYNGKAGYPYSEDSQKSPMDLYGLSKSLGEPTDCLTIRTSIIGRELYGFTGLLEWFRQQEGKSITGFAEHYWNGITTQQFGEICHQIMQSPGRFPRRGIYHVFSNAVSKFEMLQVFQRKYGVRCSIQADHSNKLNRTLATVKELNGLLKVPTFEEMVEALPNQSA